MKIVLMAIAVITRADQILLRKTDPSKNPYTEPWALFGGRIEGDGSIEDLINDEFKERWNMTVKINEKLWWDNDQKVDHDGEEKRFVYLDVLCEVVAGTVEPANLNEELKWVNISELGSYDLNPPTRVLLSKLDYV